MHLQQIGSILRAEEASPKSHTYHIFSHQKYHGSPT